MTAKRADLPVRVNLRLRPGSDDELGAFLVSEAKRRGGPIDMRGDGYGYSEILRDALTVYAEGSKLEIGPLEPAERYIIRGLRRLRAVDPAAVRWRRRIGSVRRGAG